MTAGLLSSSIGGGGSEQNNLIKMPVFSFMQPAQSVFIKFYNQLFLNFAAQIEGSKILFVSDQGNLLLLHEVNFSVRYVKISTKKLSFFGKNNHNKKKHAYIRPCLKGSLIDSKLGGPYKNATEIFTYLTENFTSCNNNKFP